MPARVVTYMVMRASGDDRAGGVTQIAVMYGLLDLAVVVCFLISVLFLNYFERKEASIVSRLSITVSDYTVMVKHLPEVCARLASLVACVSCVAMCCLELCAFDFDVPNGVLYMSTPVCAALPDRAAPRRR